MLDDRMLQDPFNPKELSFVNNKLSNVGFYEEPPTLFPAYTTSAPPAREELPYILSVTFGEDLF